MSEAVVKKYIRATTSSDLTNDAYHHDTDTLAALAMSDDEFGALLLRVKYAFDPALYNRLKDEWRRYVKVKAVAHGWPHTINERIVADIVLGYWLRDHCRPCGGRRRLELVPRVLSNDPCPHCKGTGKRPLIVNRRFTKYAHDVYEMINRLVVRVGGETAGKLREEDALA
jgi:hypothetical protein